VTVRPYREGDEEAITALWTACFAGDPSWNEPREVIRRKLDVDGELFLVGILDGRLMATVIAGYDGHRGWIYHLAVAADVRQRGLGRRMMEEAERLLRARGCVKINLQVRGGNQDVVAFYERLGFAIEDRVSMGKRL
jgi:ribosomal protein S18 acetylase RimI-like enzyme